MDSQIQFFIYASTTDKIYKIKCFNTGTYQIPGVLTKDSSDVWEALTELESLFKTHYPQQNINLSMHVRPIMDNYMCRLKDKNRIISLPKMYPLILQWYDQEEKFVKKMQQRKDFVGRVFSKVSPNHWHYITTKYDRNANEFQVKFNRISPYFPEKNVLKPKKTSIKVLIKKINFNGGKILKQVIELYLWLDDFVEKHGDTFFCNHVYKPDPKELDLSKIKLTLNNP